MPYRPISLGELQRREAEVIRQRTATKRDAGCESWGDADALSFLAAVQVLKACPLSFTKPPAIVDEDKCRTR